MSSRVCEECGRPIVRWDYCRKCAEEFKRNAYESLEQAYHRARYTLTEYEHERKILDQINWATVDG